MKTKLLLFVALALVGSFVALRIVGRSGATAQESYRFTALARSAEGATVLYQNKVGQRDYVVTKADLNDCGPTYHVFAFESPEKFDSHSSVFCFGSDQPAPEIQASAEGLTLTVSRAADKPPVEQFAYKNGKFYEERNHFIPIGDTEVVASYRNDEGLKTYVITWNGRKLHEGESGLTNDPYLIFNERDGDTSYLVFSHYAGDGCVTQLQLFALHGREDHDSHFFEPCGGGEEGIALKDGKLTIEFPDRTEVPGGKPASTWMYKDRKVSKVR